ncbi:MAG TPA: hypothetical protein VMV90_10240 [Rectinemataceae bacterium]|nr:hypothetical protein [Rectinemataceae bacterium]
MDLCADGESLRSRLLLGAPGSSRLAVMLDEGENGARLVGSFDFEAEGSGTRVAAGPGSASGALRLLADPAYLSSGLDARPGVELDSSLSSGTAVLGVEAGALSVFALERGAGAGIVLPATGSVLGEPQGASPPEAAAAGLGLTLPWGGGSIGTVASASLRTGRAGGEGWRPDPSPDSPGLVVDLGLLRTLNWPSGRAAVGLAASQGRVEGPGLAARIEAEERRGAFSLRAAAGAAGSGFRGLYGSKPLNELGVAADLRLILRRSAALGLGLRLKSKPASTATESEAAPGWDSGGAERSARLSFAAPLPQYGRSLDLSCAVENGADVPAALRLGMALAASLRSEAGLWRSRWGAELRFGGESGPGFDGLSLSLTAGRTPPQDVLGPELEARLGLELLDGGAAEAPALADLGIDLWLPLRSSSRLGLGVDVPSPGFRLDRLDAAPAGEAKLSLSYRCRF